MVSVDGVCALSSWLDGLYIICVPMRNCNKEFVL